jgi:hypothetical protein
MEIACWNSKPGRSKKGLELMDDRKEPGPIQTDNIVHISICGMSTPKRLKQGQA